MSSIIISQGAAQNVPPQCHQTERNDQSRQRCPFSVRIYRKRSVQTDHRKKVKRENTGR